MTAFTKNYCLICKKEEGVYLVYIPNTALPVCRKCWDLATEIHQLNFFNPEFELKIKKVKSLK